MVQISDCNDHSRIITLNIGVSPSVFALIFFELPPTQWRQSQFYSEPLLFCVMPSIQLFLFSPIPASEQVFVKALFDYDPKEDKAIPCKEAGLAFKKGSILQIMSQDDATWWQAKNEGEANPRAGLIPSKQFQER